MNWNDPVSSHAKDFKFVLLLMLLIVVVTCVNMLQSDGSLERLKIPGM